MEHLHLISSKYPECKIIEVNIEVTQHAFPTWTFTTLTFQGVETAKYTDPCVCFKSKHNKEQYNLPSFPTVSAVSLVLLWYSYISFAQIFEEIIQLRERALKKSIELSCEREEG